MEAMAKLRSYTKADGTLFLAVPVGADAVFWNEGRVYGPTRLPQLIAGWHLRSVHGGAVPPAQCATVSERWASLWQQALLRAGESEHWFHGYQPVLVLDNAPS